MSYQQILLYNIKKMQAILFNNSGNVTIKLHWFI